MMTFFLLSLTINLSVFPLCCLMISLLSEVGVTDSDGWTRIDERYEDPDSHF